MKTLADDVYNKDDLEYFAKMKSNHVFSHVSIHFRDKVLALLFQHAKKSVFLSVHSIEQIDDLCEDFYIDLRMFVACHPNRFCDWVRGRKTKCLTVEIYNIEAFKNTRFLKTLERLSTVYPGKISIEEIPFKKECTIAVADDSQYMLSQNDGFVFCFNKPVVAKRMREYNCIAAGNIQNCSILTDEF